MATVIASPSSLAKVASILSVGCGVLSDLNPRSVGQEVVFELAPPNEGLSREVTWQSQVSPREIKAIDGVIPLHLRILQVDGHRAWTSPWFIQL